MDEYIKREQVLKLLESAQAWNWSMNTLYDEVKDLPSADVAPVVHGKWEFEPETINTYSVLKCSKCGWWTLDLSVDGSYHHCPNCGAKLDLEDD